MTYGYARCSTNESKQDIDRQRRELAAAGAESIRFEFVHGDAAQKPELDILMNELSEGDTLIVCELSRLARSTKQLCGIIEQIKIKHLRLMILGSITIDCRSGQIDPTSEAFLKMAGVFAELELSMTRARVRSGMANAAAKGAKIGRPRTTAATIPDGFKKAYALYAEGKINVTELSRLANCSRKCSYKYIALLRSETGTNGSKRAAKA